MSGHDDDQVEPVIGKCPTCGLLATLRYQAANATGDIVVCAVCATGEIEEDWRDPQWVASALHAQVEDLDPADRIAVLVDVLDDLTERDAEPRIVGPSVEVLVEERLGGAASVHDLLRDWFGADEVAENLVEMLAEYGLRIYPKVADSPIDPVHGTAEIGAELVEAIEEVGGVFFQGSAYRPIGDGWFSHPAEVDRVRGRVPRTFWDGGEIAFGEKGRLVAGVETALLRTMVEVEVDSTEYGGDRYENHVRVFVVALEVLASGSPLADLTIVDTQGFAVMWSDYVANDWCEWFDSYEAALSYLVRLTAAILTERTVDEVGPFEVPGI